ncbi:hypothetical protein ABT120_45440 [Nonomuraea angiospora]|uniref:hypothetical protein n=1 Tax=Nonomuraea angiospora TaxID=46172 RepID=UPI003318440C
MADGSDGTGGRWRIARRTPPDRIISAVDPEARHAAVAPEALDHERGPLRILADAAYAAADPAWREDCRRRRPMVERAVAWLVARGNRRLPYRGAQADDRRLNHRAAALGLRRLIK